MPEERRRGARRSAAKRRRWPIILLVLAVIAVPLLLGLAVYTDGSDFCVSCHEMGPFYDAWSGGEHADGAQCVDCHVGQGFVTRLSHKPEAMGEVIAHIRGDIFFPRPEAPSVPDDRCDACHSDVQSEVQSGFSHEKHEEHGACVHCHRTTGHDVTADDLEAVGVLDAAAWESRMVTRSGAGDTVAVPGGGAANVDGHVSVVCTDCHDLARTGCDSCHESPEDDDHVAEMDCEQCHTSGPEWQFAHLTQGDCIECHELPATPAHGLELECLECHTLVTW